MLQPGTPWATSAPAGTTAEEVIASLPTATAEVVVASPPTSTLAVLGDGHLPPRETETVPSTVTSSLLSSPLSPNYTTERAATTVQPALSGTAACEEAMEKLVMHRLYPLVFLPERGLSVRQEQLQRDALIDMRCRQFHWLGSAELDAGLEHIDDQALVSRYLTLAQHGRSFSLSFVTPYLTGQA